MNRPYARVPGYPDTEQAVYAATERWERSVQDCACRHLDHENRCTRCRTPWVPGSCITCRRPGLVPAGGGYARDCIGRHTTERRAS